MEKLFFSHSSFDNARAVALFDWLSEAGWKGEIFLDLDAERGILPGDRWERRLHEAAYRCEAVLFLVSPKWLASPWCMREFHLASRMNKRLFGVLIEDIPLDELPQELTAAWQVVRLAAGHDHVGLHAVMPTTHEDIYVTFSLEGLRRLKRGLEQAGLDAKYFAWPPPDDLERPPYRGLLPLEADDAGILFGRDAPLVAAIDQLRGLRDAYPPRMFVVIGASGAGKSSFMRAGLLPRIARDDRNLLPLPPLRPAKAAISGDAGLLPCLEKASRTAGLKVARADIRRRIEGGAEKLLPLLQQIVEQGLASGDDAGVRIPTIVLPIDQGEELFDDDNHEAEAFLRLVRDLMLAKIPELVALITIRSDIYEHLQLSETLGGIHQHTFSLPPIPRGSYAELIKGPAQRLADAGRPLTVDADLVEKLLVDMDAGTAKDALPLLAVTLERLYIEHGGTGRLTLGDYSALGGVTGSIEAAVERAFKAADSDPAVPKDRNARLALMRRGLIPWLAGIDFESNTPRRRVARLSEVPPESRALIGHLVDQRLLSTDTSAETGEKTIEPVHEALLRQWGQLQGWLFEDAGHLGALQGVRRAARDWAANGKDEDWLGHAATRLDNAERAANRDGLRGFLEPTELAYLEACRQAASKQRGLGLRLRAAIIVLATGVVALGGLVFRTSIEQYVYWLRNVNGYVLSAEAERSRRPGELLQECASCPVMIVLPTGSFQMGASDDDPSSDGTEKPSHPVAITGPLALSRSEVTVDEWDACVSYGACRAIDASPAESGRRPIVGVTWEDAVAYTKWLSALTGKVYRLPSEAEWEYAARAGTTTPYFFGPVLYLDRYAWFAANARGELKPVGGAANPFGLLDMYGNASEWCADVWQDDYLGAPQDGRPWLVGDQAFRVIRGGSSFSQPADLRSSSRFKAAAATADDGIGFRVARSLASQAP